MLVDVTVSAGPPVGVLVPIYILFRDFGLIDTRIGLVIVYALINLPIVVWLLYTFFKEVPKDILGLAVAAAAVLTG